MLLREFDLDAPESQDRTRFREQTRCVSELLEHCFGRFETSDCWKLLVEVVPTVTKTEVRNLLGAYTIQVQGDPRQFLELQPGDKKRSALVHLMEGAKAVCAELEWDLTPFTDAAAKVEEAGFVNTWTWRKPKASPDRKHVAEVLCEHEIDVFCITIIIKDRGGEEVHRECVVEERPNEFLYDKYLGSLKWLSPREVALVGKSGESRTVQFESC